MAENSGNIFSEFRNYSKKDWEEIASNDLKHQAFENLVHETGEPFELGPFYHMDDRENLQFLKQLNSIPDNEASWAYLEEINTIDIKKANKAALVALNNGADGIIFNGEGNPRLLLHLKELLNGILPEHCDISFIPGPGFSNAELIKEYLTLTTASNNNQGLLNGALYFDPLMEWALQRKSLNGLFDDVKEGIFNTSHEPSFAVFTISSEVYKNSGASHSQELALLLSATIQYVNSLLSIGVNLKEIIKKCRFQIATGTNFFFEIAKIQALKILLAKILMEYGLDEQESQNFHIHAQTAWWTKTTIEPENNILRNTTEAMSAILGGCNSLSILPFDIAGQENMEFKKRISRNTSNILREESYLGKVANPISGSYYLQNLIEKMLASAWELVQEIEMNGGYIKAYEKGMLFNLVKNNYNQKINNILQVKDKVIGANIYVKQPVKSKNTNGKTKRGWFEFDRVSAIIEEKL